MWCFASRLVDLHSDPLLHKSIGQMSSLGSSGGGGGVQNQALVGGVLPVGPHEMCGVACELLPLRQSDHVIAQKVAPCLPHHAVNHGVAVPAELAAHVGCNTCSQVGERQ
jgi:hypothetical protein